MKKQCPRCQQHFECTPEQIESCQCSTVKLSAATLAFLAAHYPDCLCAACLQELDKEGAAEQPRNGA
jgi:hypothetical protein